MSHRTRLILAGMVCATATLFASLRIKDFLGHTRRPPPAPEQPVMPAERVVATASVSPDLRLTLFAAEPAVQQPIALAFDDHGRWPPRWHSMPVSGDSIQRA